MFRIFVLVLLLFPVGAYSQSMKSGSQQLPIKEFALEEPVKAPPLASQKKNSVTSQIDYYITLVNFWHPKCTVCVDQLATLNRLKKDFRGPQIDVLSVLVGAVSPHEVKRFYEQHAFSHLKKYQDRDKEVFKRFGAQEVPTTYVVDKKGRIVAGVVGDYDWNAYDVHQYLISLGK